MSRSAGILDLLRDTCQVSALFPGRRHQLLEDVFPRYEDYVRSLSASRARDRVIADYVVVYPPFMAFEQGIWGGDSRLSSAPIKALDFHICKITQLFHYRREDDDSAEKHTTSALADIWRRHGPLKTTSYLDRLWGDCWILDEHFYSHQRWLLMRALLLQSTFGESEDQLEEARKLGCSSHLSCVQLAECLARLNPDRLRYFREWFNLAMQEIALLEGDLSRARESARSYSDWIASIFYLLPRYHAVWHLLWEAFYLATRNTDREEIDRYLRLLDERSVDMDVWAFHPIPTIVCSRIALAFQSGGKARALQIARFYSHGRAYFPRMVLTELERLLEDGVDPAAVCKGLRDRIRTTVREGHRKALFWLIPEDSL